MSPNEEILRAFKEHMDLVRAGKAGKKTTKVPQRHLELERRLEIRNQSQDRAENLTEIDRSSSTSEYPLTGLDLLSKLAELGQVSKSEQVRACGYFSRKKSGPGNTERLNYTGFYEAVQQALGEKPSSPNTRLTGKALLQKARELNNVSKADLVRGCGYASKKSNGSERLNFNQFYEALIEAKDRFEPQESKGKPEKSSIQEKTSLSNSTLEQLRQKQRAAAQSRRDSSVQGSANRTNKETLIGRTLVEFCIDQNDSKVAETSICLRAGYKTDSIGQFRRAFSKAADVPFGPLARMIADLRRKEFQVKERVEQHLDDQAKIVIEETSISTEEESEELIAERRTVEVTSTTRVRNTRFRNAVLKAHGFKCACCGIEIPELLEAAHIVPVANDGTDHPSNGIALCPTHHSAFDRHYFTFEPGSRKLILKASLTTSQLLITKEILDADINDECLALSQRLFNTEARH